MIKKIYFHLLLALFIFNSCSKKVTVELTNTLDLVRTNEIVEIDYKEVSAKLSLCCGEKIVVLAPCGKQVAYQITYDNKLIFPVQIGANSMISFNIQKGEPQPFDTIAYGRFVPERKDDYAWENDIAAYRVYGPALKPIDGPSNGVDYWAKRVSHPIINNWYYLQEEKGLDYHSDRGEGLDCYKVGRTLGAGMCAPILDNKLVLGENFVSYETLDNGPLRTTVSFTYDSLMVGNNSVIETRNISLDAYSAFNKMSVTYSGNFETIDYVGGVTLHDNIGEKTIFDNNSVSYWEQAEDGYFATAILFPNDAQNTNAAEIENHLTVKATAQANVPSVYYFGAGWSKWGYPTKAEWEKAMQEKAMQINNPIVVTIK